MPENKEEFGSRIAHLMKESGYQSYGASAPKLPVKEGVWPTQDNKGFGNQNNPPIAPPVENNTGPAKAMNATGHLKEKEKTNPVEVVADVENSENAGADEGVMEALGEISSLLISIGFILQTQGIIEDKFDFPSILEFLDNTFDMEAEEVEQTNPSESPEPKESATDPETKQSPEAKADQAKEKPAENFKPGDKKEKENDDAPDQDLNENLKKTRKLLESRFVNFKKKN